VREHPLLVGEALGRVDDEHDHVGAADGLERAVDHEELGAVLDLGLAAQAGRVEELVGGVADRHGGVDGVARGAGHLGRDGAVVPEQAVQEGALADVGLPDDGHAHLAVLRVAAPEVEPAAVGVVGQPQLVHDHVEQLGHARPVDGRDGHGLAEAEAVELGWERRGGR